MPFPHKNQKTRVLIPDGENHLSIYAINCLSSVKDLEIYIMSSLMRNPVRFSRYIKRFSFYPETGSDQKWIEHINAEITRNKIDIVMPIFEKGIRRMIKNISLLSKQSKLVSLPELNTFDISINKWKLSEHCFANNISVPNGFLFVPGDTISENKLEAIEFPIISKPLEGFGGGMNVRRFSAKKELVDYLKTNIKIPLIIQEYIEGYDIDCSVLAKDGVITAYTIQKGFLPGANAYKPQVGITFLEEPKLLKLIDELIASLSWNGIAHIDCRYDQKMDAYKIIEVNPRIWVTVDGSSLMGVNFPELWIRQTKGEVLSFLNFKKQRYFNLKGVVKTIKKNPFHLFKIKFLMTNTQLRFVIFDPVPTVYKFYDRTKNIIKRKIRTICL